jgi:thiol-disulfide isomerase/thioredoxin
MRYGFPILILALILAGTGGPAQGGQERNYTLPAGIESLVPIKPPIPAPDTSFNDPAGGPITLKRFQGRTVVLNFWATWCAPCLKEMPALNRLQEQLGKNGVEVVTVAEDTNGLAVVKPFLARQEYKQLKAYTDPSGKLARAFGVRGLPTTVLIDPQGLAVGAIEGPVEWDSPQAIKIIQQAMGGKGL